VDAAGNAYATGVTSSSDFPTTPGAFQPMFTGASNTFITFVSKLDPTGSALVYSTFLEGSGASGIVVDASGNAYVAGSAGSTLPTTPGAFQPVFGSASPDAGDAFVAKLNPAGSALVYSTYLGGSSGDQAIGIAVDADGNAYVTGFTGSAISRRPRASSRLR